MTNGRGERELLGAHCSSKLCAVPYCVVVSLCTLCCAVYCQLCADGKTREHTLRPDGVVEQIEIHQTRVLWRSVTDKGATEEKEKKGKKEYDREKKKKKKKKKKEEIEKRTKEEEVKRRKKTAEEKQRREKEE